jgi:hypothetical protein
VPVREGEAGRRGWPIRDGGISGSAGHPDPGLARVGEGGAGGVSARAWRTGYFLKADVVRSYNSDRGV